MPNYAQVGNRWTAIFVRKPQPGGDDLYERAPFDLVRFNVDTNPAAPQEIVPLGQMEVVNASGVKPDSPKLYEHIWIVETVPWRPGAGGKVYFGGMPE